MRILEEFWYGNVEPMEYGSFSNEECKELLRLITKYEVIQGADRIEVVSPGGLPSGITAEEYLSGKLSVLRNRNLANVFYRLGFVEIFGTGIARIKQLYTEGLMKPDFEFTREEVSCNMIKSEDLTFPKIKEKINKIGNLFYQYRACRRATATMYDIENICHGVVYARTPLQMNDPFDSMVGVSSGKIYYEKRR